MPRFHGVLHVLTCFLRVRLKKWEEWTDKSEQAAAPAAPVAATATAGAVSSTPPEAADAQETASSAYAQDSPLPLPIAAPTLADLPVCHLPTPPLEGDVYAVALDLKYKKDYDELTRDEAIDLLKMLPLRVQFVPYGAPLESDAQEGDEIAVDDGEAKSVESVQGSSCPSPAEKAAAAAAVPESPTPRSETKPRSRKRTRNEHDDAEGERCAVGATVDPRPRSGGSPVKKKRGGDA